MAGPGLERGAPERSPVATTRLSCRRPRWLPGLPVACLLLVLAIAPGAGAQLSNRATLRAKTDTRAADLAALQDQSADGVIRLDARAFVKYATGAPRPYALVVNFDASRMHGDHPRIAAAHDELPLLASSLRAAAAARRNRTGPPLFVVETDYEGVETDSFRLFGVTTLPKMVYVPGSARVESGLITLRDAHVNDFPQPSPTAESMAEFVSRASGVAVAISRSAFTDSPHAVWYALLGLLALCGGLYYAVAIAAWTRSRALWGAASLAVFWFSISGGFANIIKGIPLFVPDKGGLRFFGEVNGERLGFEGFYIGSLCLTASGLLWALTLLPGCFARHGIDDVTQRLVLYPWMLAWGAAAGLVFTAAGLGGRIVGWSEAGDA